MAKKRAKTPNRGAADVRDQILDKIALMKSLSGTWYTVNDGAKHTFIDADDLAKWIRGMSKRASKKPGGLGRKPKRKK
jgi:hypothetical protein